MGFDLRKFKKAKFEPRTKIVDVPALRAFFSEGEPPRFKVRGLTGEELGRVNDAQSRAKNISALVEVISSASGVKETASAIREGLGLSPDGVPEDIARRIEMVAVGCVEPEMDLQTAAKIFRVAPIDGYSLSNAITLLSGQGMTLGELKSSGETTKSEPPSISDTPGEKCSTS